MEGSDLELVVKIDPSRKLTVDLFVPLLNQSFADDVYVPDPPLAGAHLKTDLNHCFDRLERIRAALYGSNDDGYDDDAVPVYGRLQQWAEERSERSSLDPLRGVADPDAALATTDAIRKLRVPITHLEE